MVCVPAPKFKNWHLLGIGMSGRFVRCVHGLQRVRHVLVFHAIFLSTMLVLASRSKFAAARSPLACFMYS
jgi:hypothetical protein